MSEITRQQQLEKFKAAIQEACDRYGFAIYGCGCCGSPMIYDEIASKNRIIEENYNPTPKMKEGEE
jgi:hypothetical protein